MTTGNGFILKVWWTNPIPNISWTFLLSEVFSPDFMLVVFTALNAWWWKLENQDLKYDEMLLLQ
jgi:hypothetical protein